MAIKLLTVYFCSPGTVVSDVAMLVCTLLPGALDSYRDRINSFYLGLSTVEHTSQSSCIYSRTLRITSTFFFLGSPCGGSFSPVHLSMLMKPCMIG